MTRRAFHPFLGCLIMTLAAACGGGDPGPMPLAHHFDDMHIAAIPLAEKTQVIEAQNDYSLAKMEKAKAEADFAEVATELTVARNEREQALLSEKSARSKKKAAEDSSDLTRINAAAVEMRAAELARKAADEKVTWVKARRAYLAKRVRYATENMYAMEAKYEVAKARLAKAKSIRPKGFDFAAFDKQYKRRSERAQRARAVARREQKKADAKKKSWQQLAGAASRAAGGAPTTSASDRGETP